jgi:RNA polymerase sigma factor (TIGR02999 family)
MNVETADPGGVDGDLYAQLHRLAGAMMRRERPGHTLQATALIHEAFLRLDLPPREASDERRLFACAARVMRQVLVDHARKRGAAKRGGEAQRVTLDTRALGAAAEAHDVLDLHDALERLEQVDARKAAVVDLKFFGQMTHEEIAAELGVSGKTVEADWYFARAWLRRELDRAEGRAEG